MLWLVASVCTHRLTSRNKRQPCWAQQCCVLLRPFALTFSWEVNLNDSHLLPCFFGNDNEISFISSKLCLSFSQFSLKLAPFSKFSQGRLSDHVYFLHPSTDIVFLRCNNQSSKSIHRVICEQIKVRVSGPSHLSLVLLRIPHKILLSQRWRVEWWMASVMFYKAIGYPVWAPHILLDLIASVANTKAKEVL